MNWLALIEKISLNRDDLENQNLYSGKILVQWLICYYFCDGTCVAETLQRIFLSLINVCQTTFATHT